jgi:hypothetical protein
VPIPKYRPERLCGKTADSATMKRRYLSLYTAIDLGKGFLKSNQFPDKLVST